MKGKMYQLPTISPITCSHIHVTESPGFIFHIITINLSLFRQHTIKANENGYQRNLLRLLSRSENVISPKNKFSSSTVKFSHRSQKCSKKTRFPGVSVNNNVIIWKIWWQFLCIKMNLIFMLLNSSPPKNHCRGKISHLLGFR